jgi:hypothetical protein
MNDTNERSVASAGSLAKPSGVAAACAAAADIGYAMQTVEGFEPKKIEWSRWEPFYVYTAGDGWYVGDRRKPVGNPFHFVCRCATEDEAIRCCLQWNRGITEPPTDAK